MNIIKELRELPSEEKISILMTLGFVLIAVVVVLYSFLASRGQDVEYFKHRLGLLEQRLNNMDLKADALAQSDHKLKNYLDDQGRLILEIDKAQKAQQAEIEAWKRLPKLPAPSPQKRMNFVPPEPGHLKDQPL
jgi:hypothetical protein